MLDGGAVHLTTSTSNTSSIVTTATIASATTTASTTTRLAVLADLLAELPAPERREVIASLPAVDRAGIARILVSRAQSDST
jgi:hypothetical protein